MALARWTATTQDAEGNAVAGCSIEVHSEDTGRLVQVYGDRAGTVALGNPFVAPEATFGFHVEGGAYKVTATKGAFEAIWRYVAIGTASEFDYDQFVYELQAGLMPVATFAELEGLAPGEDQSLAAIVLADPDPTLNGYYLWDEAAEQWQRKRPLPDTLARLTVVGGTANALEALASPGVDPGAVLAFFLDVPMANTGPVTLSINGAPALPVRDVNGDDFAPGVFTGRLFLSNEGDHLRAIIGGDVMAAAAAALAYAERAEAAADRAESAIEVATNFKTVAVLLADETMGYDGSGKNVIVGEGDIVTAQGFRLEVMASGAVEFDVVTEGGVKLNYAVLGDDDLGLRSKFSEVNGTISTAPLNLSESEKTQARLNIGLDGIVPQGHIFGLTLSRAVGTDLVLIRPGEAAASGGDPRLIRVGGEWTKNLAAAWSEGDGGGLLDTGAISNGTYHIFIIRTSESNEGDILASQSPTSPVMPEGYTFKRRIGSILRAGGAILPFFQDGDRFTLIAPVEELSVTNTVAKTSLTLTAVPSGVRVKALFNIVTSTNPTSGNGIQRIYLYDGQHPTSVKDFYARGSNGNTVAVKQLGEQYTDTSAGILYETVFSGGGLACTVQTLGWEDARGRFEDPVEEVFATTLGFATDIHNGDKSAYSDRFPRDGIKKLNDAVGFWNSRQVDFGIIIGDLIDTNTGAGSSQGLADLSAIEAAYSNLNSPRHYAFGNHDFDVLSKAQFIANTDMPSAYYSFDQGGIHFVVLDACNRSDSDSDPFNAGNYVWNQAYVNPAQRSWLTSDLASTSLPTVVFSHYGLHGGGYSANNHAAVRAILESSGKVKSVITGHQHVNARTIINGINYYVMMAMTQFPHPQNSYSVIGVRPDGTCRIEGFGGQASYG